MQVPKIGLFTKRPTVTIQSSLRGYAFYMAVQTPARKPATKNRRPEVDSSGSMRFGAPVRL
jgi:hypothetical protein